MWITYGNVQEFGNAEFSLPGDSVNRSVKHLVIRGVRSASKLSLKSRSSGRQLATQSDTTAGGRILLRRDLQTAWARLKADVDMRKLLTRWAPPLSLVKGGNIFERLA